MIAEINGKVVGIMGLTTKINIPELSQHVDISLFVTAPPEVPPTHKIFFHQFPMQKRGSTVASSTSKLVKTPSANPAPALSKTPSSVTPANLSRTPSGVVPSKLPSSLPQAPVKEEIETIVAPDTTNRAMCVTLFCLADRYASRAKDFLKVIPYETYT